MDKAPSRDAAAYRVPCACQSNLAAYDTDVSQASVADSRGEALGSGKVVHGVARDNCRRTLNSLE